MIGDEDVGLRWVEMLKPADAHPRAAQTQPQTRAPVRPRIDHFGASPRQPRDRQHRRRNDEQQHRGDKERPPVTQTPHERWPRVYARLWLSFNLFRALVHQNLILVICSWL